MRQALKTNWQIDLPETEISEPSILSAAPTPVAVSPAPATATVLPFGSQRRSAGPDQRPELAEIMSALSRAADDIRTADGRATQAEMASRDVTSRLAAAEARARSAEEKAAHYEERFKIAEGNVRHADGRAAQAEFASREFSARLAATEERARAAEEKVLGFEEQLKIAESNVRLAERKFQQMSEWQAQQVAETEAELDRLRGAVEAAGARVAELEASAIEQDSAMRAIIEDAGNRLFASETRANDAVRDFEALRDFIRTNFGR